MTPKLLLCGPYRRTALTCLALLRGWVMTLMGWPWRDMGKTPPLPLALLGLLTWVPQGTALPAPTPLPPEWRQCFPRQPSHSGEPPAWRPEFLFHLQFSSNSSPKPWTLKDFIGISVSHRILGDYGGARFLEYVQCSQSGLLTNTCALFFKQNRLELALMKSLKIMQTIEIIL